MTVMASIKASLLAAIFLSGGSAAGYGSWPDFASNSPASLTAFLYLSL